MNARAALAIALVAAVGAAVYVISRTPDSERQPIGVLPPAVGTAKSAAPVEGTATPVDGAAGAAAARTAPFQTAAECRSCHEEVWAEWTESYHGKAWTDPMVQALSQGFRMPECIDCHAPLPIHITGVDQRVAPRKHSRSDGVDCISCHLMQDGVSVAAVRDVDTSAVAGACRPQRVPAMADSTACAGCHNQHETVDELLASGSDKTCADCHMEPVERAAKAGAETNGAAQRKGRGHRFPGSHDQAMHKRAAKLEVTVEDGQIVARVSNVGGGHKIPTDARHRSYNLWVSVTDARGNPLVVDQALPEGEMRLYYRDQFKPSTQVAPGGTHTARWRIPEGVKGKAVVRLTYALNPEELAAGRVTEVHQAEVQLK